MQEREEYNSPFYELMDSIYSDIPLDQEFYQSKPLLAHYSSLANIESILNSREVWLANPTLMNDREELEYGLDKAMDVMIESKDIAAAFNNAEFHRKFISYLEFKYKYFRDEHFPDTYIFCLSQIGEDEVDGRLSMWRAYGFDGNGAAIVFDTSKISPSPDATPLRIVKVEYKSNIERDKWLTAKALEIAKIIQSNPVDARDIFAIAYQSFERLKLAALVTKHIGFAEEQEWRVMFTPDIKDERFDEMKSYYNGPNGIEPRLKLNFDKLEKMSDGDTKFGDIVCNFILGPTRSSNLNLISFRRMLERYGLGHLKDKVAVSTIPYRSKA
ncbi:Protein of unknown function [Bosea lupini]|uniref:DUF2971 domain-containing protein n=2 Tax=Bosea lupini TaxID=1036779 RepID=A0A1H8AC93_9HYPH|nr:Protein of unknown function [Bosea lupini]